MSDSRELTVAAPPMTVASLKERSQHVQALIKDIMVEGVHYAVVPGTRERSLTKQGSELLLSAFHIAVEPEIIEKSDADAVRYTVKLTGRHMGTGIVIGIGVGRCSSNEEKYKWRRAVCVDEFEATPESQRRIKWGTADNRVYTVQQIRTNPEDVANTVLKMAKKRAQADLCLTALAASDAFKTQPRPPKDTGPTARDVRDAARTPSKSSLEDDARAPAVTPSAGAVSASGGRGAVTGSPSSPRPATQAQLGLIRQRLDQAGIAENFFFAQFEIGRFEDVTFDQVNGCLKWIEDLSRAPPDSR